MRKVLVIDTSILCVWLEVPGKTTCGPSDDQWDKARVDTTLNTEIGYGATLVLPLATIIETGNHIAQASEQRYEQTCQLAEIIILSADEKTPWAAFTDQSVLPRSGHIWWRQSFRLATPPSSRWLNIMRGWEIEWKS